MTLLDHSSLASLLAGLREDRGVFRFLYEIGGTTPPWTLTNALTFRAFIYMAGPTSGIPADAVRLQVLQGNSVIGYYLWLDGDGWLVTMLRSFPGAKWQKSSLSRMRAMRQSTTAIVATADTLQRADQRRDKGLADIFGIAWTCDEEKAGMMDTNTGSYI